MGWFQQMWVYTKGIVTEPKFKMWASLALVLGLLAGYLLVAFALEGGFLASLALAVMYVLAIVKAFDWFWDAKYAVDNGKSRDDHREEIWLRLGAAQARLEDSRLRYEETLSRFNN